MNGSSGSLKADTIPSSLYVAFVASGMAGLTYEVVWTRYLGLFVGHSAFAQVLVLSVYLGGLAAGTLLVADVSKRVRDPLLWYARLEAALALTGVLFHPVFRVTTDVSYDVFFPALAAGPWAGAMRWGIAGLLVLPQAIVLGATFPFMAAALARLGRDRPGAAVSMAYLCNTLGGAAGVLLAGFVLVAYVGLPGALAGAALLNLLAAIIALRAARSTQIVQLQPVAEVPVSPESREAYGAGSVVLLVVAFGTAVASFGYEVGWIRMLTLVLGGATHAFELMLSAFLLGIALGAWWVRPRVDASSAPVELLARVQIFMGVAAALSLPLYLLTYEATATLVSTLPGWAGGYTLFNVARYALCLFVMLPATVAAGATLPLITGVLIRRGWGERSIGGAYGVNTLGSVAGVGLAAMIALPALGLRNLLLAAAALDVGLGVWLLTSIRGSGGRLRFVWALAGCSVLAAVGLTVQLDRNFLTSGVFRYGELPDEGRREILFYEDGRTATVSAHLSGKDLVVLSTNGKPDGSIGVRWFPEVSNGPLEPIDGSSDYTTQVLGPLVGAAHVPDARSAAIIGHGTGMSGLAFLTQPKLEKLVTIEIEPLMVEGSMVFLPVNEAVFTDPRSTFVFDDAKAYFSYTPNRFDIVFAEPSNPWVSGNARLFTREFYQRVAHVLEPDGILLQWMHLYEVDDDLVLSVLAALEETFPRYRAYLIGPADIVIVAPRNGVLTEPDWSVLDEPGFREITRGAPPFESEHFDAAMLFDHRTFAPLLRDIRANSDYLPILDARAERARFLGKDADGVLSLAADRIDLVASWSEERIEPSEYALVPTRGIQPILDSGHGAWMRAALEQKGTIVPQQYPGWTSTLAQVGDFYATLPDNPPRTSEQWLTWTRTFQSVEAYLHWGTAGWRHQDFYERVLAALDEWDPPVEVRAAVDLMLGVNDFDWERAARAADTLVASVALGERWLDADRLLDAAVLAYAKTGRMQDGLEAVTMLAGPEHESHDVRVRLLLTLLDTNAHPWDP